jgi:hypothetical protein
MMLGCYQQKGGYTDKQHEIDASYERKIKVKKELQYY